MELLKIVQHFLCFSRIIKQPLLFVGRKGRGQLPRLYPDIVRLLHATTQPTFNVLKEGAGHVMRGEGHVMRVRGGHVGGWDM